MIIGRKRLRHSAAKALFCLSLALICFLPATVSTQEFYRWVDDKGAVHLTDNLHSIPEKYRNQAQKRVYLPPQESSASNPEVSFSRSQPGEIVVPFKRNGNLIIVEGLVNNTAPVRFILDTGAEISTLPRSVGQQLGIDAEAAVLITMTGMGGSREVPLVEINSIRLGEAEVNNLDVTLSDTPLKDTGLLGADFLLDYKVNIRYAENQVVLEPQQRAYGGHSFEWWQKKFRLFYAVKRRYEALRSTTGTAGPNEVAEKQLRAVEQKISDLETRASQAGIPREFRQ